MTLFFLLNPRQFLFPTDAFRERTKRTDLGNHTVELEELATKILAVDVPEARINPEIRAESIQALAMQEEEERVLAFMFLDD